MSVSVRAEMNAVARLWALDWLVCIGKLCLLASPLLSLGIV